MTINESRKVYLKLREAAVEAQRREMEQLEEEISLIEPYAFSDAFHQKMEALLRKKRKPSFMHMTAISRRAAVIILAVIMALTVTFSVKALREPIVDFIISVYEKFSSILFHSGNEEVTFPNTIEEVYCPVYVPAGYSLVENNESIHISEIKYSNGKDTLVFEQYIISSTKIIVDTEGIRTEILSVDDTEILFYNNKGVNHILWNDSAYGYQITGVIDKTEMIKMVKLTK